MRREGSYSRRPGVATIMCGFLDKEIAWGTISRRSVSSDRLTCI